MKIVTLAISFFCMVTNVVAEPAGLKLSTLALPHHGKNTDMVVWYPEGGGGERSVFAENPVFEGVEANLNADVKEGKHPIVLFSHGLGGTIKAQAWLAHGLAKRGAIVVGVNHPNTTRGSFDLAEGVKHWTRATDLSIALDALLIDPKFKDQVDLSRVMAAGFSYGGWTAFSLGGMAGNHAGFVQACEKHINRMEVCNLLLSGAVNMQALEPSSWNANYTDSRVTHVAAIDPGLVWGLDASNTKNLVSQTTIIGLGREEHRMFATNFKASGLQKFLPHADIKQFDSGFHFTAMPICKPNGEAILKEEKDDPVCTDPHGTDRAAIHVEIIDLIATKLGL